MKDNFELITNRAKYKVTFREEEVGFECWVVDVEYLGHKTIAKLHCPKEWARTMLFQFLDSYDNGIV